MATVGGVTVEILRGNTTPEMERVRTWTVDGLNGIGAQRLGSNQSSFVYTCVLYGLPATVESRLVTLAGLQGTVISVTDDFGEVRGACLVVFVGVPSRRKVFWEGSSDRMRATVQLSGVRTA